MMKYNLRCLLSVGVFCLLLHAPLALGQDTGSITGTIVAARGGAPLANVNVLVAGTLFGAATDAQGRYTIDGLPPQPYLLRITALGYETAERALTVRAGEAVEVNVRLRPEEIQLDEVEVSALPPNLQPRAALGEAQIEEPYAVDAGQLLRTLPGVHAARRGALGLDPSVRGLSETEVGTYIDGARVFPAGPLRMDSPLSHVDPSALASVEVVKGPYALTWGAGNLSAIRVETQGSQVPAGALNGNIQLGYSSNLRAAEVTGAAGGRTEKMVYWVNGAYRTGGNYEAGDDVPALREGGEVPGDFTSGSIRGRIGYQFTPSQELTVSAGYQDQRDIDYPGRLLDADYFTSTQASVRYQVARAVGLVRTVDVLAYANRTDHAMNNAQKPTAAAGTLPDGDPRPPLRIGVDAAVATLGGRAAATLAPVRGATVTLGADVYSARREATRTLEALMPMGPVVPPFYETDEIWPDVVITDAGVFASGETTLGQTDVSGTVRLDLVRAAVDERRISETFLANADATRDDLDVSEANLSAALSLSRPLSPRWRASAGVGTAVRTADALERYADRFPASKAQTSAEFQGDPFLEPERSTQADLWLAGSYRRFDVNVSAFARQMTNYITLEPTDISPLLPLSPPTVYRYVNGEAMFYGVEGDLLVRIGGPYLVFRAGGSYLWGEDTALDEPAFGVAPPTFDLGLRINAPFELFFFDLNVRIATEQDRIAETRGEIATEGYVVADLHYGMRLPRDMRLYLGIDNLGNAMYVHHLNARDPYSGTPIPEPGRVFFARLRKSF